MSNATVDIGTTIPVRQEAFPGVGSFNGQVAILMGKITLSASVASGGDVFKLTSDTVGAGPAAKGSIYYVDFNPPINASVDQLTYDYTNQKVQAWKDGSEVTGDLHTIAVRFIAWYATRG